MGANMGKMDEWMSERMDEGMSDCGEQGVT